MNSDLASKRIEKYEKSDKGRARRKRYYEKHKEKLKAYQKEYYKKKAVQE